MWDERARRARAHLALVLQTLVEQGNFRRDLFYRIHGGSITIPTVRERSDRLFVARGLLSRLGAEDASRLSDDAEAWILEHDWPGNVRELKSGLAHALALAEGGRIAREHFPRVLVTRADGRRRDPGVRSRDEMLRDAVREAMRACDGNIAEAARRLGVARSTVYRALRDDHR